MLRINNLSVSYGKGKTLHNVIKNLSVDFIQGFNVILGPNGAGKSTLMKAVFNILSYKGDIHFKGINLKEMTIEEKSKYISYLPQSDIHTATLSVLEMVLLGRLPELGSRVTDTDLQIATEVLDKLNLLNIAHMPFNNLSGGQQKIVLIAQTLVRNPELILLDEPINSLDLKKQIELCELLTRMIDEQNLNVITVMHDINLAAHFADYIAIFDKKGSLYSQGKAIDVITEKMLKEVYGISGKIYFPENNIPQFYPFNFKN